MGHLVKTEEGEDREHDNDEADKINDTVHGTFLRGCPTSKNLRCSMDEKLLRSSRDTRAPTRDKTGRDGLPGHAMFACRVRFFD
jgi:hypothetical protein